MVKLNQNSKHLGQRLLLYKSHCPDTKTNTHSAPTARPRPLK